MPHIQGAIAVAELVKKHHPETPVIFGGLSSTYFHEELLERYESIDFVVRGDSTEEPLRLLMEAIQAGRTPYDVPNLSFRDKGAVMVNPLTFVPEDLDYSRTDYAPYHEEGREIQGFCRLCPLHQLAQLSHHRDLHVPGLHV